MPDLIMITGPQAVGKMTVGQELAKLTNFKLFHNHMSIDLVNNFFSYSTREGQEMVKMLRINMFKYFSESSIPGIIFTCVVNYDKLSDIENISIFKNIFESNVGKFYYVELNLIEIKPKTDYFINQKNKILNLVKNKYFMLKKIIVIIL